VTGAAAAAAPVTTFPPCSIKQGSAMYGLSRRAALKLLIAACALRPPLRSGFKIRNGWILRADD
jgi:hypothetical protein